MDTLCGVKFIANRMISINSSLSLCYYLVSHFISWSIPIAAKKKNESITPGGKIDHFCKRRRQSHARVWTHFFYFITGFTIARERKNRERERERCMSARTRYKYLKRYPHFHVSPSQFEFPLHSAERSGKSPDARYPRAGKFITRYVSYGTFWRTGHIFLQ